MDKRDELKRMIIGNVVLTQLQAIVVGFLAALVALAMGWVPEGRFNLRHALVLCISSVSTASLASLALGTSTAWIESKIAERKRMFCSRNGDDRRDYFLSQM